MKSTSFANLVERLRDCLECLGKRPWLSFLLIFSLAAAVRFAILVTLPRSELTVVGEAESIARTLATQGRFADPFGVPTGASAHTPPFYPFLLSLVYRALGIGIAAEWVRCALGILAYSILYGLLPRISVLFGLSGGAGVVAGVGMAILPLRKSGEVSRTWEDPYAAIALAFLIIWTLRLKRQEAPSWRLAALYGIAWGALFHIAATPVVTFGGLAAYLLFSSPDRWRTARWLSIAIVLSMLMAVPWAVRNRRELGAWMFMRDNLGLALYSSNSDGAQPTVLLNFRFHHFQGYPSLSRQDLERVLQLGELGYNREQLALAKAWIVAHPGRFAALTVMRAGQMWFGVFEEPRWLALCIAVSAVLGLLGLGALWHASKFDQAVVIGILWLTYPSVYFLFQYANRYRGVFDWSIALSMGFFLMSVLDASAARSRRRPGLG